MDKQLRNREIINDFMVSMFHQVLDIEQGYMRKCGLVEISLNDLRLLDIASSLETPTMSEIARHAHLTNGTITSAIKKLEEKGYAIRQRDDHDKRVYRVQLTDKGQRAVDYRVRFFDDMVDAICEDHEVIDNDALINALEHLTDFFEKVKGKLS